MAKQSNDLGLDAALDWFANVDAMHVCSQEPLTYTEATATYSLGSVAVSGVDFTKQNGAIDGRALVVAAKTAVGSADGNANHIALVNSVGTTLRYVTTAALQAIVNGANIDIGSWTITLRDPV